MKRLSLVLLILFTATVFAQSALDPAFDPPPFEPGAPDGRPRWNGTIGMVIINGRIYQQFGLRPDIPFGKFGVGLDFTFRFDADGNFKDDEWDEGRDYLGKIYYVRYGFPGDPLYIRVGALDNVTLGYGIIMRRYSNAIQYPEVKRIGVYSEGRVQPFGWQVMTNNLSELDEPGILAGRLTYNTDLAGLTVGATVAHDGNQFAGLSDQDNDGVPDRLDQFPDRNDFLLRQQLRDAFASDTTLLRYLIANGFLPDVYRPLRSYKGMQESVTLLGVDAGLPLINTAKFSLWTYAQLAKIVDFGWGFAFPGVRSTFGPLDIGFEFRHYGKEFRSEFFNYVYEIERVQMQGDSFFTKERSLRGLGAANGWFGDARATVGRIGYLYAWYLDMRGNDYHGGKTFYGEVGVTPPRISRLQKVAAYYMQPNMSELFERKTDGTMYGTKAFFALARNVSLVYDHRITYYGGESHRTVRVETMVTF